MDRCNLNGLVTAHERLTQRNMVQSRRAVLEYELQLVGCELRSDSQLCDCYIDRGEGDPVTIAGIMAEMKFFHEHTDYSDILDDLYDEAWEAYEKARNFYGDYDEYIKPLKVEKEISDFVHDTLKAAGFSKDYELLDVVLACINKRVMMPLFREAFKEAVKAVTKIPGKPQSFSAQVLRLFGQNANPSSKTLKQRMGGTWHCTLCKYSTTPGDLRVHWAKNHNVNTLADISAVKYVHTESSFLLLVDEACVKIIARHHAARIIQRRWRLAISSPAFEVCRRRLLREVSELEIMS
ncbi:hypothetical protein HXX76_014108 [Chlamydomonas incerta]|uniref:Uncharacterized protein n=1 Tax=Chlamydomonas incerta TaxID=51695 RepID=A0A835SQH9_CHLIN|nr:hypothetical protein HXX76_014108 [Chlamydomonas incerta]|eukprot:KAG2424950.1 hypothetical protein HXX76_014108 [Chlamydomonas incerta]